MSQQKPAPDAKAMDKLLYMMARLRDPETGCPWDVKQDFATIAPYTIEEAYEVADAIDRNDYRHLKEELGDLLLQVVFHSQMATEQSLFDFEAVAQTLLDKMVRRHPHVFPGGDLYASVVDQNTATSEVKHNWDRIKAEEKAERGETEDTSALAGVPANMAALIRAQKLQKKASKVGFDWPDAQQVFDKFHEEVAELEEAVATGRSNEIADELGDLLFTCVNLVRKLGLDADAVLRGANQKFERRFREMEHLMESRAESLTDGEADSDLDALERAWQQAKQQLSNAD